MLHSEWRKLAKKCRRKRIRQKIAIVRHEQAENERKQRENSPSYQSWLEEQRKIEEFQTKEEARLHQQAEIDYLERERIAQEEWKKMQVKLAATRAEREKQIAKIKLEWEKEQEKLRKLKEEKERKEAEKKKQQDELQERIEEFINSKGEMPEELNALIESNPGKVPCPFFKKTFACRFGDSCSRNHIKPTISKIILIRNFYSHYSLEQTVDNEHGSDSMLEFESDETYNHFKEFFLDVLPEMENFGRVRQFKVCSNKEIHLRGNVYVEYASMQEATKAFRALQGRWYGGKQLNVDFCIIDSWKAAICGLYFQKKCPKGSVCNFLHVFRNPGNLFRNADRDLHRSPPIDEYTSSSRNWRWSESPEPQIKDRDYEHNYDDHRSGKRKRERSSYSHHHHHHHNHHHHHRKRARSRSRSKRRKKAKERSKSKITNGSKKRSTY